MKIDILCVGKLKEHYFVDAITEYSKRMSRYVKLSIIEVKDEKTPDHASEKEENQIKKTEAERLEQYLESFAYKIALCIEGKSCSSEEFSLQIADLENTGKSHIQFIIGGSLGIHDSLKKKADYQLSFSQMTLPYQLMRVVLLEQIYRAYKIKTNEPYHK